MYSYHDEAVLSFTRLAARPAKDVREHGTFYVDLENMCIYVYSNKFSTFAIGYTAYYHLSGSMTFGSFDGTVDATLTTADGTVVATLTDVAFDAIDFTTSIPKGDYLLTITWTEGVSNSITIPFTVGAKAAATEESTETGTSEGESEPLEDPFEDVAGALDDVVLEDRIDYDELIALPRRDVDAA